MTRRLWLNVAIWSLGFAIGIIGALIDSTAVSWWGGGLAGVGLGLTLGGIFPEKKPA